MKSSFVLSFLFLGIAGHTSIAFSQSPGTFTATGNMATPRFSHITRAGFRHFRVATQTPFNLVCEVRP